MKYLPRTALLLLGLTLAGCASTGATGGQESDSEEVYVQVDNQARADLDVSVLVTGQEIRLGRVQIGDQRRLYISSAVLRTPPYSFAIRLIARDGTGTYTTPPMLVREGQNVVIEASPTLSSSRYTVR